MNWVGNNCKSIKTFYWISDRVLSSLFLSFCAIVFYSDFLRNSRNSIAWNFWNSLFVEEIATLTWIGHSTEYNCRRRSRISSHLIWTICWHLFRKYEHRDSSKRLRGSATQWHCNMKIVKTIMLVTDASDPSPHRKFHANEISFISFQWNSSKFISIIACDGNSSDERLERCQLLVPCSLSFECHSYR